MNYDNSKKLVWMLVPRASVVELSAHSKQILQ